MKIQDDQAERLRVAPSAIQFFFEGFSEKPAIVKTSQGVSDGIQFEFLEIFVLEDDGYAEETGRCQYIQEDSFQSHLPARLIRQAATPNEHFIPDLDALRLRQLNVSDGAKEALKELSARGQVETLERIRKQLEIRVLDRQTRGRQSAGAGHIRNNLTSAYPRGVWGKHIKLFYSQSEQPRGHSYWSLAAFGRTGPPKNLGRIVVQNKAKNEGKNTARSHRPLEHVTKLPNRLAKSCTKRASRVD